MGRLGKAILTAILIFATVITGTSDGQVEDRVLIGAYDPAQVNGLVFITNDQNFFGVRFIVSRPGSAIEERPETYEFGANAPDGSYASINWLTHFDKQNPVIIRWCRTGRNTIVGRLTAPTGVRVMMETYI